MRRAASRPFNSGIAISRITMSRLSFSVFSTASRPVAASRRRPPSLAGFAVGCAHLDELRRGSPRPVSGARAWLTLQSIRFQNLGACHPRTTVTMTGIDETLFPHTKALGSKTTAISEQLPSPNPRRDPACPKSPTKPAEPRLVEALLLLLISSLLRHFLSSG